LTATNTYTGTTTVSAGTLTVTGSTHASSAVTVASGATIAGTGTVNGSLSVSNGGILAPGDGGVGTFNAAGGLTLNDTSVLTYQLNTTGASDKCVVTGNLTLNGTINCTDGGSFAGVGTYLILTCTGTLTDSALVVGTMPTGMAGTISVNTGTSPKQVNLVVTSGITISGHVYSNETGTALAGKTVKVRSNGATYTAGSAPPARQATARAHTASPAFLYPAPALQSPPG
jgi:fibronectin-binding autotransporter adhesin